MSQWTERDERISAMLIMPALVEMALNKNDVISEDGSVPASFVSIADQLVDRALYLAGQLRLKGNEE